MKMNKRGQGTIGQAIVYALISIFALAVLHFFMLEVATVANLEPILRSTITDSPIEIESATQTEIFDAYDLIIGFLRLMPYILYVIIVAYIFIRIFRRERVEEYG